MTSYQLRGPLFDPAHRGAKGPPHPPVDPVSVWLAGWGRHFDYAITGRRRKPDCLSVIDHAALASMNGENGGGGVAPRQPGIVRFVRPDRREHGDHGDELARGLAGQLAGHGGHDATGDDDRPMESFVPVDATLLTRPDAADASIEPATSWSPGKARPSVVTAIIDDAFNLAHRNFRDADGQSRIDFAWIQDGEPGGTTVPFGREIDRDGIDAAVSENGDGGPEDRVLRALGLVDYRRHGVNALAGRAGHGTAVADLAAGAEDAADRRIVTVALPREIALDTSGYRLHHYFLTGLQYVLQRVRDMQAAFADGRKLPVVVNFSYGITSGPHDGRHVIERVTRLLIANHKARGGGEVTLLLPAGNSNLARGHAHSAPGATSITLPWRLQPADQTASYMEVWFPENAGKVVLKLTAPDGRPVTQGDGGQETEFSHPDCAQLLVDPDGGKDADVAGLLWYHQPVPGGLRRLVVCLAPTEIPADPWLAGKPVLRRGIPSGIWRFELRYEVPGGAVPAEARIMAWIARDEPPFGSRVQARQSYFDEPSYERFTPDGDVLVGDPAETSSVVRREGTINGLATDGGAGDDDPFFIAGAYLSSGHYSGRGGNSHETAYSSTAFGNGRRPDAAAPADYSRGLPGVLAAGTHSGSTVVLNGTSVASPQIARRIADLLANDPTLTPSAIRQRIREEIDTFEESLGRDQPQPPPSYIALDSRRAGAGRVGPQPWPRRMRRQVPEAGAAPPLVPTS
ncbi:MAG: S8 family serine peptidase [Geminicoccaceae bacterium]|nr:S8 family serine peptidase [Geminicoccaceae bacterium]